LEPMGLGAVTESERIRLRVRMKRLTLGSKKITG
jgi:hypothetical protein